MALACDIGVVGLGVMGRNLALNLADHGFAVAGLDKDAGKAKLLETETAGKTVSGTTDPETFTSLLRRPRAALLLVPASVVDAAVAELRPLLTAGDLIIDAGNSHFADTDRRAKELTQHGLAFLGMGVSGGEAGARHGPSLMPGGPREAYERIRPLLEAVAAKVDGEPCVAYLGPGSAGHFVKMVHNGIEYAAMQIIAESYDLLKRGLGFHDDELSHVYKAWNEGALSSYLIEITSHIFNQVDEQTGKRVIDEILDVAKQKGTGMWTSQSAMELQVPVPTIDVAVAMRDLSVFAKQRDEASGIYERSVLRAVVDYNSFLIDLRGAILAALIIAHSQGMALLGAASEKYEYHLDLETIARIWKGGCIIRSSLLENIQMAFHKE